MVRSMTSFGRSQSEEGKEHLFSIEMKSVNNRYLDINTRMPKFMIALEEEVRKLINKSLNRGKVDVFINFKGYNKSDAYPTLNLELAKGYYQCLKEIADSLGVVNDITATKIARFQDVLNLEVKEENLEDILEEITPLISEALNMMVSMREVEGEKLKEDIIEKLNVIETHVKEVNELSFKVPQNYKKKLYERVEELTKGMKLDEERLATEIAIFADKAAVDEEITRLNSHISQMRKTLNLSEPIGRKLDFIVQEMNRETNTIGSKANDMEVTNIVINIKNLLEKIREQVQNIE